MARPVQWSRELHAIRERAARSRIETWSRLDIEHLFGVSRASAQNLMKAIGEVQTVGAAHFVDRTSLLRFLDEMIAADSVGAALQIRHAQAAPVPRPRTLRVTLAADLRRIMLPDLPNNIRLSPGRIEITGESAKALTEGLLQLATVMQNDLERWREAVEPSPPENNFDDLQATIG